MSLLDMDERLLEVVARADLVYSPLVDAKEFPDGVDIVLIEGAVSTNEDLHKLRMIRERSKILVSLGDCAVTSNVPGMRNPYLGAEKPGDRHALPLYERAYFDNVTSGPSIPSSGLPTHLAQSIPVHKVVPVDVLLPGCPPSADLIFDTIMALLDGRQPDLSSARFGR
jgi:NAD-reducing hydrogenase small subunit